MAMPDVSFAALPGPAKRVIFYGALALLYLLYGLIIVAYFIHRGDFSAWLMEQVAAYIPIAQKEVSVPGELVPVVLGGLMAWTAPGRVAWLEFFILLGLSAVAWAMYLHLQVFFSEPDVARMLSYESTPQASVPQVVSVLTNFASSVRSFAAVVFAATLGLRLNQDNAVLSAPRPAAAPGVA